MMAIIHWILVVYFTVGGCVMLRKNVHRPDHVLTLRICLACTRERLIPGLAWPRTAWRWARQSDGMSLLRRIEEATRPDPRPRGRDDAPVEAHPAK
jgi:hypothetical protein